ncbi:MAG: flavodoxin family protein [Anaerolineaceae bacterium]|nr:flavodoxin family protein [Anaerolineaceae bacterium]
MEKIIILNGHPKGEDQAYLQYIEALVIALGEDGASVECLNIYEKNIRYCTGCWTCWWVTPGRCIFHDDMEEIYRMVMAADQLLYIGPMVAGYVSAETKRAMDRMIPLLHPYIEVVQGECHHRKRYDRYPSLALIVQQEADSDEEDMAILEELMTRLALNFRSQCDYVHTMAEGIEEVRNEACYV